VTTAAKAPRPRGRGEPGHAQRPGPTPARVASAVAGYRVPVVLPTTSGGSLPGLALRHSAVVAFWSHGADYSIFLHPFARPALPGVHATMSALTPAGRWEHRPEHQQVSLRYVVEPSDRSVSNHPWPPSEFGLLFLRGLPRVTAVSSRAPQPPVGKSVSWASPFPSRLTATTGRIEFVPYGPAVRLGLLPTSSRDDAVTFGYKVQTEPWQGLPPCRFHALAGALAEIVRFPAAGCLTPPIMAAPW